MEREKTSGRRSSREMMKVVADMWQQEKKCCTPKIPISDPTFHLDSNGNLVGFW